RQGYKAVEPRVAQDSSSQSFASPDKRGSRESEGLLHASGNPTYQALADDPHPARYSFRESHLLMKIPTRTNTLNDAVLVCYAVLDERVGYAVGHGLFFVDGKGNWQSASPRNL